ncbi:MAG: hypothetical protein KC652_19290 [Cyanobacteria bacterium HKST-UBA01]|nr:hypothetical protein [Cyanobacteria bacterium HKST-UBA01]
MQPFNQLEFTDFLMSRKLWLRIRKPVILFFVFFHFYLILLIFMRPSLLAEKLMEPFYRYTFFIGIEQGFNVFAPSPRQNNNHVLATITYENGATEVTTLPRMERYPQVQKLFHERYRKFLSDNVTSGFYPFLYKDIAFWVARKHNTMKNNPPKVVTLFSYTSQIPPMENGVDPKLMKSQLANLEDINEDKAKKDKSKPHKSAYNEFNNPVNPPRWKMKVLTVQQIDRKDLE